MTEHEPQRQAYTQTWNGRKVWLDPAKYDQSEIDIECVMHGLPTILRYMGQTTYPYSVAQHCIALSLAVERLGYGHAEIVTALIHDWPEAYFGDIPGPFKNAMPLILALEERIYSTFAKRYGALPTFPDWMHQLDRRMLRNEMDVLGRPNVDQWWKHYEPVPRLTRGEFREMSARDVRWSLQQRCEQLGIV